MSSSASLHRTGIFIYRYPFSIFFHSFPSPSLSSFPSLPHLIIERMNGDEVTSSNEEQKKKLKRICVFCGSRAGYKSSFSDAALHLGTELVTCMIES